jgi:hypothetical protein
VATALASPMSQRPASPWPWVAGAVGLAGVAVGSVTGALVIGDKATIDAQCHADHTCTAAGLQAASQSRTFGFVSDVAFAAGGAGLATATILFLTSPNRPGTARPVVAVGPHTGFVGAAIAW